MVERSRVYDYAENLDRQEDQCQRIVRCCLVRQRNTLLILRHPPHPSQSLLLQLQMIETAYLLLLRPRLRIINRLSPWLRYPTIPIGPPVKDDPMDLLPTRHGA